MSNLDLGRSTEDGPVVETATEARQGRWGRHVFWVLVASLTLVVIVLFASWAFRANDLAVADGKVADGQAAQVEAPPPDAAALPSSQDR